MFSAVMNTAQPNSRMEQYNKRLTIKVASEVSEASLFHAAKEAIEENEGCDDVAAAFDGTCHENDFKSLIGVMSVT